MNTLSTCFDTSFPIIFSFIIFYFRPIPVLCTQKPQNQLIHCSLSPDGQTERDADNNSRNEYETTITYRIKKKLYEL